MVNYEDLKNNFFMIAGPNVIESREHVLFMAKNLKEIFQKHNIQFIFKTSIDDVDHIAPHIGIIWFLINTSLN